MFTKKTDTLNTANNNTADQSSDGGVTVEGDVVTIATGTKYLDAERYLIQRVMNSSKAWSCLNTTLGHLILRYLK